MQIIVNGQDYQTSARTAAALLEELRISQTGIAMALDGEVIRRSQLASITLLEGSKIEIVHAVQGG